MKLGHATTVVWLWEPEYKQASKQASMQASNTTSIASISGRHGVPKAGPDIEKALDPVLVFIRGTTKLFEFVDRRYFEHFG